ncbi:SMP-30/gluconolactonase/LRE family protein [Mycolicibacterium goodii]|uniref:SMP-30/gluconolactonase/LRE family protein n=1 Tax=Mycolicibacterium goodii TaxID=134601 RepID=UPI000C265CD5|nr:SMP-30/gluconolactonase/LRE family protein [Mycolicibacterium goodii]PJK21536.1 gluconolactonase [Mycolicibacterium goodii]
MTIRAGSRRTTELANGFCFGEGPRWFEGLLWFSDMLGEAVHTVTSGGSMTTLSLPGHAPSGLGFRPDGTLCIVSTEKCQVLCYDGETVELLADLRDVAPAPLGDMVLDRMGRAYVGSQARSGGMIVRIDPDDTVEPIRVVADGLDFPNGMAFTPDGDTLVVAESTARRLTAYTVDEEGDLSDRRIFAEGLDGPPDGIAIDARGGVWAALTLAHEFCRIVDSGPGPPAVTDRVDANGRTAIACALGGAEGRTLFMVTSTDAYPQRLMGTRLSRVDALDVDIPAPGHSITADHHHH